LRLITALGIFSLGLSLTTLDNFFVIYSTVTQLISCLTGALIGGIFWKSIKEKLWKLPTVALVENFYWSWENTRIGLNKGLISGFLFGVFLGFIEALNNLLAIAILSGSQYIEVSAFDIFIKALRDILAGGIIGMFSLGLLGALGFGSFTLPEPEKTKITPNQGIWISAKNGLVSGLSNILIFGLPIIGLHLVGFSFRLSSIGSEGLSHELLIVFGLGLVSALNTGGYTFIRHFILRLVLYWDGYIPWNYARFLNYCTDRLFLQRVGGRYRFLHRLIQEHFAEMPLEKE
jgi:hypothetical protein